MIACLRCYNRCLRILKHSYKIALLLLCGKSYSFKMQASLCCSSVQILWGLRILLRTKSKSFVWPINPPASSTLPPFMSTPAAPLRWEPQAMQPPCALWKAAGNRIRQRWWDAGCGCHAAWAWSLAVLMLILSPWIINPFPFLCVSLLIYKSYVVMVSPSQNVANNINPSNHISCQRLAIINIVVITMTTTTIVSL